MSDKNGSETGPIERTPSGRFAPGNKGGPGRPRGGTSLVKAIQTRVDPNELIDHVLERIRGAGYSEKDKQWALDWIAKQGYKLPAHVVEVATSDGAEAGDLESLSDAELDAIIAEG